MKIVSGFIIITFIGGCKKTDTTSSTPVSSNPPSDPKPKADFSYSIVNDGSMPCDVSFTNTSLNSQTSTWDFGGLGYNIQLIKTPLR